MSQERKVVFHHVVLDGTAYEMGRTQADLVRDIPGFSSFLASGGGGPHGGRRREAIRMIEEACPGLAEEVAGLADGLGFRAEDAVFYLHSGLFKSHCSHFTVPPSRSVEGTILVGRSYEFADRLDDLRLATIRGKGKCAFIGSTSLLFGFNEGMNEHGLVVTMSSGGIPVGIIEPLKPPFRDGVQYWVAVRALLETCRTVDEALDCLAGIPLAGNPILILADTTGSAALVEVYGDERTVKREGPEGEPLSAANHYTLPEMLSRNGNGVMRNSIVRLEAIRKLLADRDRHDRESIREILSAPYPKGPACRHYDEGFGTLRSMIFDPAAGELAVCFGTPDANGWHLFDLTTPPGSYPAVLPVEAAPEDFFSLDSLPKGT